MNTTILRETRKININNINEKYITRDEFNKYLNPPKTECGAHDKNKVFTDERDSKTRMNKKERKITRKSYDRDFNEWYDENRYEIDIVFGYLLGIYTSKKVVFYTSRNELYTLFVKKYYRKVNRGQ